MSTSIWTIILCVFCLLFSGYGGAELQPEDMPVQPQAVLPQSGDEGSEVRIAAIESDVIGDGGKSTLELYASLDEYGNPLVWSVRQNGVEKARLEQNEPGTFSADAVLQTEDLDGDGKREVLIYRRSSGSAGAVGLTVLGPSRQWTALFSLDDPFALGGGSGGTAEGRYAVTYAGDGRVRFVDAQAHLDALLPLDMEKYELMDKTAVNRWLERMEAWIDPVSEYVVADEDGDGVSEIVTVQRIIGISHPDTIGFLKTTYRLEINGYKAVSEAVFDGQDRLVEQVRLGDASEDKHER